MRPEAVYFFGTCLVDLFHPEAGMAGIRLLQREGIHVIYPQGQTCCGQPAWSSGYEGEARDVVRAQVDLFPGDLPIVVPSGSCAAMLRRSFGPRVHELTEFLVNALGITLRDLGEPVKVAWHASCHATREMGVTSEPKSLLRQLSNVELLELSREFECCGFGGTFSVRLPEISDAMVKDKAADAEATGATELLSADCGCLMTIARATRLRARHIAEFLWERTGEGVIPSRKDGEESPAQLRRGFLAALRRLRMTRFRTASAKALRDPELRANFRRAMDGLMGKRAVQFGDRTEWMSLRARGAEGRARALAKLPQLLEQLEARCRANGIDVHWAETTAEANEEVLAILRRHGATRVVKGKSMVSEEMHLNDFLERHGIESLESDLGEYIIQLDHETPSHIIMPAIHKNRRQIARLFGEKIRNAKYTEDVDELTGIARAVLRRKFEEAHAGISGVNFAVAETGTLFLVENEGNGRMSTHVPPVHIALMGIEKVLERLDDVPPLLTLLTRSATGQTISTYLNMITAPRAADEKDGPREVHLVILDNGRSEIYADAELRATLRCIRCGACMNHCPVYTRVGGHAYDAVYPGPIGTILTPQLEDRPDLTQASSLCGACVEVCPVEIPITRLMTKLRGRKRNESVVWRVWWFVHRSRRAYSLMTWAATRFGRFVPARLRPLRARPARHTLHELARKAGVPDV